tara:strand:+ start:82 stop:438 length:357 start_codon:yes stop_codon:yes gene_type:complete
MCFVLDQAKSMGLIPHNAAREVPRYPVSGDGFHTWTEKEIETFYSVHPLGTMAHTAMTLMLYTGASLGDTAAMGRSNIKDGRVKYSRYNTKDRVGVSVDMLVHPFLAECLDTVPAECA